MLEKTHSSNGQYAWKNVPRCSLHGVSVLQQVSDAHRRKRPCGLRPTTPLYKRVTRYQLCILAVSHGAAKTPTQVLT